MSYTIYNPANGAITATLASSDAKNVPLHGVNYIQGAYDALVYYINKNKKATLYPPKPYNGYWIVWLWNLQTTTWSVNTAASATAAKKIRDNLLIAVDRVNPMWWNSMTTEQQAEVSAYRQALLNVPEQSGFPTIIEWPTKPAWL
jgi:hypothetical protein